MPAPFGRLSVKELEREIAAAEVAVANTRPDEAGRPRRLPRREQAASSAKADAETAAAKLKALEAEYYARES